MRVGTSIAGMPKKTIKEDHPHACGDKINLRHGERNATGSSPCVWGQEPRNLGAHIRFRIIPMRVGTRLSKTVTSIAHQDHPHACGDKFKNHVIGAKDEGSSPCVWGQAYEGVSFDNCDRIIPMRVGTSGNMQNAKRKR